MNVGHVIKNCFSGVYALLRDPAGTICLLVLGIVSFLCFRGKVSDVAFSACCTLIPAVIALLNIKVFQVVISMLHHPQILRLFLPLR